MKKQLIIFLLFVFPFTLFSQGYKIDVQINGLKDTTLILGHYFTSNLIPDDTVFLDQKGRGTFEGEKPLPGGMYFIYLPSQKFFELLIDDDDQEFFIGNDTTDFVSNVKIKGSKNNEIFFEYQQMLQKIRTEAQALKDRKKQENLDKKTREDIDNQISELNKKVNEEQKRIINAHPDLFVSTFIKATREIEVPDPPRDENGNITDSLFQYQYYRDHYFDNLDFTDGRLLRTPIYENKFKNYIEKIVHQHPDSLILAVDHIISQSRKDPDVFRYVMVTLFNHYAQSQIMGHDGVLVHIAENYYIPEADWSSKEFITKLKKQVESAKPTLIGNIAPDFQLMGLPDDHFILAAEDTLVKKDVHAGSMFYLHQVNAPYIVLAFWEYDCGHCKTVIPKLHDIYEESLKDMGVAVVAVHQLGGVEGKEKWIDFVNKNELYGWVNAWTPYNYDYKKVYNLKTTPVIFILDSEKKIKAKNVSAEQARDIITELEKTK
ncbi:MAG: thioredoxin-like domain-containing protein [Bacteroidota bacterium]